VSAERDGYLATVLHREERSPEIEQTHPNDPAGAAFQPDLLLPSQMAGATPPDDPCRRLVVAVLERALLDAVGPTSREAERADARAWIASDDDAPFSFVWVTNQLGIDPAWLRGRVLRQPVTTRVRVAAAPTPEPAAEPAADGRNAA
jgi:hypothetical protein